MKATLWLIVASLLIWGANLLGLWPVSVLVGVLFAILYRKKGRAIGHSFLAGIMGWGLQLIVISVKDPILPLAKLLGGILGVPGAAGAVVAFVLPLIVGGLLALSGAWIISSIRNLLPSSQAASVKSGVAIEQ